MGQNIDLTGHVESIAGGIEDRERTEGANLLANVNPSLPGYAFRSACLCE